LTDCADASIAIAKEVGYTHAGTVEFLVDVDSGDWYFIEMNPAHPGGAHGHGRDHRHRHRARSQIADRAGYSSFMMNRSGFLPQG